jgi:hypothetical protein
MRRLLSKSLGLFQWIEPLYNDLFTAELHPLRCMLFDPTFGDS